MDKTVLLYQVTDSTASLLSADAGGLRGAELVIVIYKTPTATTHNSTTTLFIACWNSVFLKICLNEKESQQMLADSYCPKMFAFSPL